jgi:hypothetical protein
VLQIADRQHAAETLLGAGPVLLRKQNLPQPAKRLRFVGIEFDRPQIELGRRVDLPQRLRQVGEIEVRGRVVRVDIKRPLERFGRLSPLFERLAGDPSATSGRCAAACRSSSTPAFTFER